MGKLTEQRFRADQIFDSETLIFRISSPIDVPQTKLRFR